jgi:hypothetical protein
MLPHDSQGFLTGETIADIRRIADELSAMRADIALIRRSVMVTGQRLLRQNQNANAGANINPNSNASGSSSDSASPQGNGPPPILPPLNGETAGPGRRRHSRAGSRDSEEHNRDDRGRFTNNNENPDEEERKQKRLFSGMADRIADAVTGSATGLEDIDPTIKAINEVAQPLARGYRFFVGGDKDERWYRKLFRELNLFRREQTVFNRTEQRILREIDENTENQPGGQRGSGFGSGVLGALAALFGLRAGSGIGGGLGRIMSGIGSGVARGGRGALSLGGRFLKRIPVLGALLTSLGAAADIYGSETDESLTRREKDRRAGTAIGGASGTIGGAMAGAAMGSLLGPVGTVVGGVVGAFLGDQAGQIIGDKIGEWTNSLRDYDLPGKVMALWAHLTDSFQVGWEDIKKKWGDFVDKAVEGWGQFTSLFESAYEGLKKLPVIGSAIQAAEDMAKEAKKAVTDFADQAWEKTKSMASNATEWLSESTTLGKGVQAIKEVIRSEGKTRVYKREDGGQEMRTGGSRSWRNNNPGNINYGDFAKRMGAIGSDGRFAIFPTYETGRKAKEELIFNGKNYKNLPLSEAIARYAPPSENNTSNYQKTALAAVGGKDKRMRDYSPEERLAILNAIETKEGFKVGNAYVSGGVMPATPAVNAYAPSPSVPAMPKPTVIAEAPQTMMPIVSDGLRKSLSININKDDIGQDISDRRLAHIVTGGLSS